MFNAKTEEDIDNFILKGYDINFQEKFFGLTFLHVLVKNSSPLLDYFLSKNPKLNIKDKSGNPPLFYAKDIKTIEKLLSSGASYYEKDLNGKKLNDINPNLHKNYIKQLGKKLKSNCVKYKNLS